MQITINLPEKLISKFKPSERERIIKEALEKKAKPDHDFHDDSFFKWATSKKDPGNETRTDVSANHDKYLYGEAE